MSFTEFKGHISCEVRTREMLRRFAQNQKSSSRTAIMISTPSHGNLGDQAIVYAQKRFLADTLPGFSVFEIQRYQYELARERIQGMVRPSDIVVVDGGGNVGTLWPEENDKINDIVSRFVDCSVLVFPQTAYFEDSERGRECERETAAVYRSNPNLVFFSRDRKTFEIVGRLTPDTPSYYVPDIVPYIDDAPFSAERSGALLCLRDDKERILDDKAAKTIDSVFVELGLQAGRTSTVVEEPTRIYEGNRDAVLGVKWAEFSSSELVITDRLHGMFFSAITGTPCVALDNLSHKVSQGFEWIEGIPNVRLARTPDEIPVLAREALAAGPSRYSRAPLDPVYGQMREVIRRAVE